MHSAPLPAKSDDHTDVFGELVSSCSIPFLDLPYSVQSCEIGGSIGYSGIFGGFNGGDFAIGYEELSKNGVESKDSSNGRVQMDAKSVQKAEVSGLLPDGASCKDNGACSENNKISSSSSHLDRGSDQFSLLHQRTNHSSRADAVSGKTHMAQLHGIPGVAYTINSCFLKDVTSDNSLNIYVNGLIHNVTANGRSNGIEQEKISSSTYSTKNIRSHRAEMKTSNEHAASEDGPVNMKHSSYSSTNHSSSNGDLPYRDVTNVKISVINLQTQPTCVVRCSNSLPKVVSKQENTKVKTSRSSRGDEEEGGLLNLARSHQIHYKIGTSKSCGVQSSDFIDVEVDASSAAAASVAAMKEAMEQAQARLKSAKKLMERKRNNMARHKKLEPLGPREGTRYNERNDAKAFEEEKNFSEGTANRNLPKEDKGMKDNSFHDSQKVAQFVRAALDHEESQTDAVKAAGSLQMRRGNGFKSSHIYPKSEDLSGEWKTDEQCYELLNNEEKVNGVRNGMQEDAEKKVKTTMKVNEVKERYSEKIELACEFNWRGRLHKVDTPIERVVIGDNSQVFNMTSNEEIRKPPEKIQDTCLLKENKQEDSLSSPYQDVNQKIQVAQEALVSREELKKPNVTEKAPCGESEINVQPSNNAFIFEEVHDGEENKKLHAAKEACENDDTNKEFRATYTTSITNESEDKLNMLRRTGVKRLLENENEMETTSEIFNGEAEKELVAPEETYQYENYQYTRGNDKHESYYEESEGRLESSILASKHGRSGNPDEDQGVCKLVQNDLNSKAAQDGDEVKEYSEELISMTDANLGLQQNKMTQNADRVPPCAEKTVKIQDWRCDHAKSENGKFTESNGVLGSDVTHNQFDAAQEVCKRAENQDVGDIQQVAGSENKDRGDATQEVWQKSRSSSHDAAENFWTAMTENSNSDVHKKENLAREKSVEREHDSEQARKAEEEKEQDMEREKERLAVETETLEAHERALCEARERVERIAVEKVTAGVRQRALTEDRGKAEKASANALEKSLLERALKVAKLRAERAAVERATTEARERAIEKAIAEKAAADARRRTERQNTTSRDKSRKDIGARCDMDDREIKLKANSSDVLRDAWFQSSGSPRSSQKYADSTAYGEVETSFRCKVRFEKHQRTVQRAAKAVAGKNLRDVIAQREQAEKNRLAESLDADVRRWSTGKEGNLRALLSTLQYILGPESGWQSIPLTDVITAAAVKKAYRKATLCVHPDKLQQRGASIRQKYICEKVFAVLKEAWNTFNSEEQWQIT